MKNSGFIGFAASAMPDINYKDKQLGERDIFLSVPFAAIYSECGIISTVDDLNLWLDAYFGGRLFPESMLEKVYGSGTYNYGWKFSEKEVWSYSGALHGFRFFIVYDHELNTKIIQLYNYSPGLAQSAIVQINRKVLNKPIQ